MKTADFKRELKRLGVPFEQVKRAFKKQNMDLYAVISDFTHFPNIINELTWKDTNEGYEFWEAICRWRTPVWRQLAAEGRVFDEFAVEKCVSGDWKIGDQYLNSAQRTRLFKLLAKDLGYGVEE